MEVPDKLFLHHIVAACGIDLKKTRALRNQVQNPETGATSWDLWQQDHGRFDLHQGTNATAPSRRHFACDFFRRDGCRRDVVRWDAAGGGISSLPAQRP